MADRRALDRELMRVRSDGAAVEVEEYQAGVAGVAAPVPGPDGEIVGAIGVSVAHAEFAARRWELERLVRGAAVRVACASRLNRPPRRRAVDADRSGKVSTPAPRGGVPVPVD